MGLFTHSKSRSPSAEPPSYQQATGSQSDSFVATRQLQVEAIGYDTNQALTGNMLENISVYPVGSGEAAYTSIRLKRSSNSCALVPGSDERQPALISTIYRFGPGRHPRMRILPPGSGISVEDAVSDDDVRGERIDVKSRSMVSRAQVFDTSLGKFEWRYGTSEERHACNADSLLIMERTDRAAMPNGAKSEKGAVIARLIRNEELRTRGSKKYSGGNGGRLMLDLRMWTDDKHTSADGVEAFVVASCILMLKREADRFINNNIAAVS